MLTVEDIKKLTNIFVTKEEMRQLEERMESKFDTKFDKVMGQLDIVIGELKIMREEQVVHAQRHDELERDLEEIKAIPVIAHELKKKS